SSGPTTYDFTAGLAAPAWRISSRPARRCSSLIPALKVRRLMWKIMVFSFSVGYWVNDWLFQLTHGRQERSEVFLSNGMDQQEADDKHDRAGDSMNGERSRLRSARQQIDRHVAKRDDGFNE